MSLGPQYTSCVEAKDFEPLNTALIVTLSALIVVGSITAVFTFGVGAVVAIGSLVQLLRYVLDFMLNGKLICLHRNAADCNCGDAGKTVCAIGEVIDTEAIGEDKNPFEDIDNDYAMNLLLAPFDISRVGTEGEANSSPNVDDVTVPGSPQEDLLQRQPDMPSWSGYRRTIVYQLVDGEYHAWSELVGRDYGWGGIVGPDQQKRYGDYLLENAWLQPRRGQVPVFHCEFEGSRIRDMLAVLEAFSLGGSWCKKNWFFRALCVVLQTVFAPFALAGLAIAWASADDGSASDALQGGGTISSKDWVVARGRWVFDGGHDGWNEMHATRIVQKISPGDVPVDAIGFRDYWKRWCERLSEVPHVLDPGLKLLSPEQQAVADNQSKPENQWTLHPAVDGCTPADEDHHERDKPDVIK